MRVAFVVGHTEKDKGAYSEHLKVSEWDFYNEVLQHIPEANVFYHNPNNRHYTSRIQETSSKINKINFDLVIEMHFNAATPLANGCETLYYFNSEVSKGYAKAFSDVVTRWTGIKLRNNGLKALVNKNDRGFASVYYPEAPTILIEPFFGSNKHDCEKIKNAKNVACIIDDFLAQY